MSPLLQLKEGECLKYMGSKARLSKDIAPIINNIIKDKQINTYIEPFVGGANMIDNINCDNKIGADNNEYLIEMWKGLQGGWNPPKSLTREEYNDIKNNKNNYPKELVAIAGFCATYNAKWFGGYAGVVTTKIGTERNYYDESIRNIKKQVPKLMDVEFIFADYQYFTGYKDTLIYCDPPYQSTTKYDSSNGFDHDAFWNWVRRMSKYNVVLVSEYDAPDDFKCIYEKTLTTTLDKNSRKKDTEKLFVHRNKEI